MLLRKSGFPIEIAVREVVKLVPELKIYWNTPVGNMHQRVETSAHHVYSGLVLGQLIICKGAIRHLNAPFEASYRALELSDEICEATITVNSDFVDAKRVEQIRKAALSAGWEDITQEESGEDNHP